MFTTENFLNDVFLQPVDQHYICEESNDRKDEAFEIDDLNSTTENDFESSFSNINSNTSFSPLFLLKNEKLETKNKSPSISSFLKVPLSSKKNLIKNTSQNLKHFNLEDYKANCSIKISEKLYLKEDLNTKITKLYFTEFLKMKLLTECTESTNYEQQLIAILSMRFKL